MSLAPDGRHHLCDRCDTDVGNGGLVVALVIADVDPDRPGMVRNLHFCRDRVEQNDQGEPVTVKGCAGQYVLTADNLAAYTARQEASRG